MHLSLVQTLFAILACGLLVGTMAVLQRRRLNSKFPLFFNYLIAYFAGVVLILGASRFISPRQYFYAYWIVTAITMLLAFAVLYEVFVNILKPYSALIDLGKLLFGWATAFLLLASVLTAFATSGAQSDKICAAVLLFERSVQLMQCGLLLLFVLFENRLGLSWRNNGMAIVMGLGIGSAMDLVCCFARGRFPAMNNTLDTVSAVLCCAVVLFWLTMFLLPEPERKTAQDSPARIIFQRWNEALIGYGYRDLALASSGMDSFLPGVEKTVERVLARKMVN